MLSYITRAGVEIGVASTKAFTTQLTGLFLLTLALAQVRGNLTAEQEAAHIKSLRHLPAAIGSVLALEPQIMAWADRFASKENALFLGRGMHYPIALEGAQAQGNQLHPRRSLPGRRTQARPLALVTEHMPVVTIAPGRPAGKAEVQHAGSARARRQLYVFADADSKIVSAEGMHVIRMPEHWHAVADPAHGAAATAVVSHGLRARHGRDKPRNLAKSVTVE